MRHRGWAVSYRTVNLDCVIEMRTRRERLIGRCYAALRYLRFHAAITVVSYAWPVRRSALHGVVWVVVF